MTDIDVTEIRIILEDLTEEQLINILGKKTVTLIKVKKMY